jgi:hypothetical protein
LFCATGCYNDKDKVRKILERDGYTEVDVGGWTWLGCSDDDTFKNSFTAKKGGEKVDGYACGGWLKGLTIRID